MKKVLLLGAQGMLGHAVYNVLRDKYDVIPTTRHTFDARIVMNELAVRSNRYLEKLFSLTSDVDFVVNAIGVTIPFALRSIEETFFVNSALPHLLARHYGRRLIHITTDCVYDGRAGFYDESAQKSPIDLYGLSKSLGEPEQCLTIRTSIIGREIKGYTGLLEWFLRQHGKVKGFRNHYWNGITTYQFGLACDKIISAGAYLCPGIYHVHGEPLSKYEMLCAFRDRFSIDCDIEPSNAPESVNRTLASYLPLNKWLKIPSFNEMLQQIP